MSFSPDLEEAHKRIEECRRTRAEALDLSCLTLTEIPEEVFELTWLWKLDVSHLKFVGISLDEGLLNNIPSSIIQLTELIELNLNCNKFRNLNCLKHLPSLSSLACAANPLNDLFFLEHLPQLTSLNCAINKLVDFNELQYLPNLQSLNCNLNSLGDLNFLKQVPNLQSLGCSNNDLSNVSPLVHVPKLQVLNCNSNNLSDLSTLQHLPQLQSLDCGSNHLNDISTLKHVPQLQSLDCSSNQLNDLSALEHVPQLQSLECSSNQLSDLSTLEHVPQLQSLKCSSNKLSDLSALKHIPKLQSLKCNSNQLGDLSALKHVPKLQSLECSFNQLSDLSTLKHVPNLQSLKCSSNKLSDLSALKHVPKLQSLECSSNKLSDLSALKHIPKLQSLKCNSNQLGDLSALKHVPKLQSLECSSNQLNDLSTLKHIPKLQSLKCNSNQLGDLSALKHVPKLQSLECSSNRLRDISQLYESVISKRLVRLILDNNQISSIPPEIFGNAFNDCAESLCNYWLDLEKGEIDKNQLKVQFVGNGRVGKTTLAYVLEHKKAPAENFKSTHGITIREIPHKLDSANDPVNLQFWDFGGQEIYHATHRLFLGDDCLYLLLWAEETEEHPNETRHPVSYWLELIHDLAPNSPVILIKNQIDRSDKQSARPPELADDELPGVKQIRQDVKISAQKYQRMNSLRGAIEDVLEELQHRVCLKLPKSWVDVEDKLKALNEKTLPYEQFRQLCVEAKINDPEWFADYLHKTGFLFYRKGAFQDQIILDQNWAITATYRLFDPKGSKPIIEGMNGSFYGAITNVFWPNSNETERQIYLSFMHNCGICYEPGRRENHDKPFAERKFIVPALLPKQCSAQSAWNKQTADWQLDIEYNFLHRSIIERLIMRLDETYTGEPWRNGIFCTTEFGKLLLEHDPSAKDGETTQKRISCHLRTDGQPAQLLHALRKLVRDVSPHQRYQEYLHKGEEERQLLEVFKETENNITSQLDEQLPAKTVRLFISYSRTDRADKLTLEKHLRLVEDALRYKVNFIVWSDKSMDAGEGVNEQIMPELKRADIIVLLTSPDFFDPDRYSCREELPIALQRHKEEGIPVIPVILRHTSVWAEKVGHLTVATQENALPLEDWPSADKYWDSVATGIRAQVEKLAGLDG